MRMNELLLCKFNMYRYRKSNIGHEKPDTDSTFRMFPFIKSSEVSKTNLGLKKSG